MNLNPMAMFRVAALPLALLALSTAAQAGSLIGWNEAVNGDLSGNNLAPTPVVLGNGDTSVFGTTGRAIAGGPVDRDYFSINIPAGFELTALTLLPGTVPLINVGFIALMQGSSFTVSPDTQSAEGLLGFALYSENDIGNDLLPAMAIPALGSSGFTPPLPAGAYSFWVQETGLGSAPYGFAFSVTAVPEPATALSLLAGLGLVAAAAAKRR